MPRKKRNEEDGDAFQKPGTKVVQDNVGGVEPVGGMDVELAASREEALGAAAPPAAEPLDPGTLDVVGKTFDRTSKTLTGGAVALPPLPPTTGPQEIVPAPLFARVFALAEFLRTSAASGVEAAQRHVFDPGELAATNDGLMEMAAALDAMAQDQELIAALESPQPAEQPPAEAPAEPSPADRRASLGSLA